MKLPQNITFVDIETTGSSFAYDRIIEIGVIKVQGLKITKTFSSLINPQMPINPYILQMTGISPRELENSPTFAEILETLSEYFTDTTFAAHNVRFDYG